MRFYTICEEDEYILHLEGSVIILSSGKTMVEWIPLMASINVVTIALSLAYKTLALSLSDSEISLWLASASKMLENILQSKTEEHMCISIG